MKRTIQHLIDDFNEYMDRIVQDSKGTNLKVFAQNKLLQDAMLRRIEILGEISKNLPKEFKKKFPDIEWDKISGTRDRIAHKYDNVNLELVWEIIKREIPLLKTKFGNAPRDKKSTLISQKKFRRK